ncbi:hypothetical protein [Catenulispora rubra]|uniref:hypothetical protein n=1 Tax=Catenulispora rubra TaxID=280293 RepID=UPI00189222BE|nr:hypothetical protein [Catenulispora rubra]
MTAGLRLSCALPPTSDVVAQAVNVDGRPCRMMQLPGMGPDRPIDVPLWLAVSGPKGVATAVDLKPPA